MGGHITRGRVKQFAIADGGLQDSPQRPGLVVVGVAVLAFAVCITNFALGQARVGLAAGIVALLAFGAGLSWLSMDRRRLRDGEREVFFNRAATG